MYHFHLLSSIIQLQAEKSNRSTHGVMHAHKASTREQPAGAGKRTGMRIAAFSASKQALSKKNFTVRCCSACAALTLSPRAAPRTIYDACSPCTTPQLHPSNQHRCNPAAGEAPNTCGLQGFRSAASHIHYACTVL
jgi:hypothetical protein